MSTDTDMTAVAAEIAQEHVDLKNELRDLAEQLEDGNAPDQRLASKLREILEDY
jgi:hypothetical protein